MKAVILARTSSTDQGTFGYLLYGGLTSRSLELPWRENQRQRSCIPKGVYVCRLVNSPKFGRVYSVLDVPGRSAIRLHSANFAGDVEKGWTTQLHGCIAPCLKVGVMRNSSGVMQAAGLISRPALRQLMDWARGEPFTLEIL